MEQDFGELAMRKPPYSMVFFPFRPKDSCSSIVELVNDILFDIPRDAGTGGQEGQPPPLPFARRGKGGKGALSI
jgi:hypothetical protein